ncbi:hypothetical protein PFISCL1PPCAC_13356, partial [Pristionchus fissidentatus]
RYLMEGEVNLLKEVRTIHVPRQLKSGKRPARNVSIRVVRNVSRQAYIQEDQLNYYLADNAVDDGAEYHSEQQGNGDFFYEDQYIQQQDAYVVEESSLDSSPSAEPRPLVFLQCRVCAMTVQSSLKRRHIHRFHLNKPLYTCPHCNFQSYHHGNINKHLLAAHERTGGAICHKEALEGRMMSLLYSCFTDPLILRYTDDAVVDCVSDLLNTVCEPEECVPVESPLPISPQYEFDRAESPRNIYLGAAEPICIEQEDQRRQVQKFIRVRKRPVPPLEPQRRPIRKVAQKQNCCVCGIKEITHTERHVLQHHLKQKVFCCYFCEYANSYAPNAVRDHIRTQHPEQSPLEYGDYRVAYAEAIRDLTGECFPPCAMMERVRRGMMEEEACDI